MNATIGLLCTAVAMMGAVCGAVEPPPDTAAAPPAVGDALPAFESVDDQGRPWNSAEHVGKSIVVIYFYPGDFTGGCVKQAEAYREQLAKIQELGVEVIGVSGDEIETHKLFKETYGLQHALLADPKGDLAKALGVPITAGGKVRAIGADRKPLLNAEGKSIFLQRPSTLARWTFVVGRDGKVVSQRKVANPVKDAEDVLKIVEQLPK